MALCAVIGFAAIISTSPDETPATAQKLAFAESNVLSAVIGKDIALSCEGVSADTVVPIIIELEGGSVLQSMLDENSVELADYIQTRKGKAAENAVRAEQRVLAESIEKAELNFDCTGSYSTLVNALCGKMRYGDLYKLYGVDDVKRVSIDVQFELPKTQSGSLVDELTEITGIISNKSQYDGSGMVLGIIDSGVDYTHEALSKLPEVEGATEAQMNAVITQNALNGVYLSKKVVYAYDYADKDTDPIPNAFASSNYGMWHGTHVTGIITGNSNKIQGVVPNAQIAIFKVFSDADGSAYLSTILSAVEDAAIMDLDGINMSVGQACGFRSEAYSEYEFINELYEKVDRLGITLCCSAGNSFSSSAVTDSGANNISNPETGVISLPSSYDASISVASIDTKGSNYFIADGHGYYYNPAYYADETATDFLKLLLGNITLASYEIVSVDGYGEASDYEGLDVTGKAVIVNRGGTSFEDKNKQASLAGAALIIIHNNAMSGINPMVENLYIPMIAVSMDDGASLRTAQSAAFSVDYVADPEISSFSSKGPLPDLTLKPDITAPGGEILSSVPELLGNYAYAGGTSMASPNTLGSMTALRQYLRENYSYLTDKEIQTLSYRLLMSTANIVFDLNGLPITPRAQGSGLVNLENALATTAYLSVTGSAKTSLSLYDDVGREGIYTLKFNLVNTAADAQSFTFNPYVFTETIGVDGISILEKAFMLEYGITYKVDANASIEGDRITIEGNSVAAVTVVIKLTADAKTYMDRFENGIYVEGFMELAADSGIDLSIPFLSFYGDWTEAPVFDSDYYDGEDPYVYETQLIGRGPKMGMVNYMYFVLGSYMYGTLDEIPAPDVDKIAISINPGSINYLYTVAMGLLRSVSELRYTYYDANTGEVFRVDSGYNVGKCYYANGRKLITQHALMFSAEEFGLANNTQLNIKIEAFLDTGEKAVAAQTIEYKVYVDYEKPELVNATLRKENGKTYLDMELFDNHYLQCYRLYTPSASGVGFTPYTNYNVPIYSDIKNDTTIISFDLTDKVVRENAIYMGIEDYAMNYVEYKIDLGELDIIDNQAGTDDVNITDIIENGVVIDVFNDIAAVDGNSVITTDSEEEFVVNSEGVLTAYNGNGGDVVIPDNVKIIGNSVFTNNVKIKKVTLPEGLTTIGDYCFEASSVTEVVWPTTLTTVNKAAFYQCGNLAGVLDISKTSIESIGTSAFAYLTACTGLKLPKTLRTTGSSIFAYNTNITGMVDLSVTSLTQVPSHIFWSCSSITEVIIPLNTTIINATAFGNCFKLTKVNLPNTLISIGTNAFQGVAMTEMTLPSSITSLGASAFINMTALKKINAEDTKITVVNSWVFKNTGLVEVILPETCERINANAFQDSSPLEKVYVPKAVDFIGWYAFGSCVSLKNLDLSQTSIKEIEQEAFRYCTALKKIELPNTVEKLPWKLFYRSSITTLVMNNTTPPTVGSQLFSGVTGNCRIFVPEGCLDIYKQQWSEYADILYENGGFKITDGVLTSYTGIETQLMIPSTVHTIAEGVFKNNTSITQVSSDGNLAIIEKQAFYGCSELTSVSLPDSMTAIGEQAFGNCAKLDILQILALTPPTLAEDAFVQTENVRIYVPDGCGDAYKQAAGWSNVASRIKEMNFEIDENGVLFSYIGVGGKITLPDEVKSIGDSAFSGNSTITSVVCNAGLRRIEQKAFFGCNALSAIEFNQGLEFIGYYAFASSALTSVTIPDSVTTLDLYAFAYVNTLEKVDIACISPIGAAAFYQCGALKELNLPEGLASIESNAFFGCNLQKLTIPSSVTAIGPWAFFGNEHIKELRILGNVQTLSYSFCAMYDLEVLELRNSGTTYYGPMFTASKLTELTFYGDVTNVTYSFSAMQNLKKITFCGNVDNLDLMAFSGLPQLEEVVFMNNVGTVTETAFNGCPNLIRWTVGEGNEYLTVDEHGLVYADECTRLFRQPANFPSIDRLVFPDTLKFVDAYAFSFSGQYINGVAVISNGYSMSFIDYEAEPIEIGEVVFPAGMTEIGAYAFNCIDSLQSVTFNTVAEDSLTICGYAFYRCTSLKTAGLKEGVKEIEGYAFAYTDIGRVDIPEKLEAIGGGAYAYNTNLNYITLPANCCEINIGLVFMGCKGIDDISIHEDNPYFITEDGITYNAAKTVLVFYSHNNTAEHVVLREGILKIGALAFSKQPYIKSVTMPESLKVIGDKAFYGAENLKECWFKGSAPVLECYIPENSISPYGNFVTDLNEATGDLTLFFPEGENFMTYVWRTFFGTIISYNQNNEFSIIKTKD